MIGYVGASGLATGAHLHYELMVNGTKVDPMRVRLPNGKVLKGDDLAAFKQERDRIDLLLKDENALAQRGQRQADELTAGARAYPTEPRGARSVQRPQIGDGRRDTQRGPDGVQTPPFLDQLPRRSIRRFDRDGLQRRCWSA